MQNLGISYFQMQTELRIYLVWIFQKITIFKVMIVAVILKLLKNKDPDFMIVWYCLTYFALLGLNVPRNLHEAVGTLVHILEKQPLCKLFPDGRAALVNRENTSIPSEVYQFMQNV